MDTRIELPIPIAVTGALRGPIDEAEVAGLNRRWALWLERGRLHDECVRRRFRVLLGVLAIAAVVLYLFLG